MSNDIKIRATYILHPLGLRCFSRAMRFYFLTLHPEALKLYQNIPFVSLNIQSSIELMSCFCQYNANIAYTLVHIRVLSSPCRQFNEWSNNQSDQRPTLIHFDTLWCKMKKLKFHGLFWKSSKPGGCEI